MTGTAGGPVEWDHASSEVPPAVLMACTIPVAWLEVPPAVLMARGTTHCAGGQVPPTVLVAKYHPLC